MRTEAWADKMLQTQMASWAQLRHDNILYVKQSVTTVYFSCQYPAGYVEPYPAFYKALREYAQAGRDALTGLDNTGLGQDSLFSRTNALQYFDRLITIAGRLRVLAEKELQLKEFTAEENAFLKSIMVQQKGADFAGCAGPIFEDQWNGWYSNLFYRKDENPAVIADVHTNPNNDPNSGLYPPRVLHAATGPVAPMFLIVDTDEGAALYVGPAFSYFEVVSTGSGDTAPTRLTDAEWRKRLEGKSYPPAPPWTASFRLPAGDPPSMLSLPSGVR
jgi:hypothetical protein